MSDSLTTYKLIILKMLDQATVPLTGSQISDLMLVHEYTDYFTLQQILAELEETGLVEHREHSTRPGSTLYQITDSGKSSLAYFAERIPEAALQDINAFLKEHEIEIRETFSNVTDCFPAGDEGWLARCLVREPDSTLIELTLSVPSEDEARAICSHWQAKSQEIYAYIMRELL
ncbi:MAG: DUF4364 family protein [Lachnospiraceae bacterium]|nr:DUF4364 family protein [Lachnospiraceae bacterium]